MFTKFIPTEDKIKALSKKLMQEPLYLSDEYRNYELIHKMLFNNFSNKNNIFYEIGEFGGLLGFLNIVPEYKADMFLKLWDKNLWGATFARGLKKIIKYIMIKYDLKRLASDSQDPRMAKMGKIVGFKVEGRQALGFRWDGELYTLYKLRILRKELGGE